MSQVLPRLLPYRAAVDGSTAHDPTQFYGSLSYRAQIQTVTCFSCTPPESCATALCMGPPSAAVPPGEPVVFQAGSPAAHVSGSESGPLSCQVAGQGAGRGVRTGGLH